MEEKVGKSPVTDKMKQDYIDIVTAELVLNHGFSLKQAMKAVKDSVLPICLEKYSDAQMHVNIEDSANEILGIFD